MIKYIVELNDVECIFVINIYELNIDNNSIVMFFELFVFKY